MTPSALTPAARGSTKKERPDASSRPSSSRGSGHRSTVRRSVTPSAPRRVSGPKRGVASVASAAASAVSGVIAVPAPTRTPPARPPRPARPARTARPKRAARTRTAGSAVAKTPWRLRTSAYVRRLPDHALLDRIIRGRVWIPLLGLLLAGIVAMQVEVLKLNAGIGRSLERSSALQGQNELLRASVAQLSDDQRIERIAAQMGMVMPSPDQLRFVHTGPNSVQRALNSIHAPDGSTFISQLPTPGAPAAPQGTSINTNVGLTPSTTASSTSAAAGTTAGATGTSTPTTGLSSTSAGTGTSAGTSGTSSVTPTGSTTTPATTTPAATTPATTTPATTSAGGTDQSGTSGGVGATPVGG